jgi:hypothetical protein
MRQMGKQAAVISIALGEEGKAAAVSAEQTEQVRDMARKLAMHAVAAKVPATRSNTIMM